jgi:hypothetical protein
MQQHRSILRTAPFALALAFGLTACADAPTSPSPSPSTIAAARAERGTGLVLDNLTGITLPLIGSVGDVDIDQANITRLVLVEDVVGNVVGLQAEGVLRLTGGVLGTDVVTEDFLTEVHVASSGPGQCEVLTVDLGPVAVDALGDLVSVDAPAVAVTPRASGALGPLLCGVGSILQPPVSGATSLVRGLVNAINRILI